MQLFITTLMFGQLLFVAHARSLESIIQGHSFANEVTILGGYCLQSHDLLP